MRVPFPSFGQPDRVQSRACAPLFHKPLRGAAQNALHRAMRILIVTEALVLGGAETFVLRLARQLRKDGHEAEILCLNPDFEDPRLVSQFPDVPINRVPVAGLRTIKRLDRIARAVGIDLDLQQRRSARWIEAHLIGRFDVHHTHLFGADQLFARIKQQRPGLALVSTLHGDYALYEARSRGTERSRILHWRPKLTHVLRSDDRWVTISPAQHEQFTRLFGVDPAPLVDIPNGFAPPAPIPALPPRADTAIRFVMVARGIREKGWEYLVQAFGRLSGDVSLALVGEGGFLEELKAANCDPRIDFTGAHPNPAELIGQGDIFVHPSVYAAESMPTVIVEALYAGKPVIATAVGSVAGMIAIPAGKLAGTLVNPNTGTLVDELAAAMQAYVDDPALRRAHAALAPAAFAKFDMEVCAAAYAALYADVASSPPTRSSH